MEYNYKFYQLDHRGNLMFEKYLEQLAKYLGGPYPEFFGVPLNNQAGGQLQWVVTADLRGKMASPSLETIWFSVKGNNWMDGIVKAMQEALARLCGQNVSQIKNTRIYYYPRHHYMGSPVTMP